MLNWDEGSRLAQFVESVISERFTCQLGRDLPKGAESRDTQAPRVALVVLPAEPSKKTLKLFASLSDRISTLAILPEGASVDTHHALLRSGASDCVQCPIEANSLVPRIRKLIRNEDPIQRIRESVGLKHLVGEAESFVKELKKIPLLASYDIPALIAGETGTGKEFCARAIHYLSDRSTGPFVPVNCGALPADLIESELYGHELGAYTGAGPARKGLIEEASGGTLFLDEIDSLLPSSQVKLLRFLQDKKFRRLGSSEERHSDTRVVAATNIDLPGAIEEGRIRQDLFYRLELLPIILPPLRERHGDIPLLARFFLKKWGESFKKTIINFTEGAMSKLTLYDWPGNVRELEHAIERAVLLTERPIVSPDAIVLGVLRQTNEPLQSFQRAKHEAIARFERSYLLRALEVSNGNVSQASSIARKPRRAFWALLKKYSISPSS